MIVPRILIGVGLCAGLVLPSGLAGQPTDLGDVDFPVTCSDEATAHFDRGIALLHSFGYSRARRSFEMAAAVDPECAIGHWGIAMTRLHPLWNPPNQEALEAGSAAAMRAAEIGGGTERETGYIAAIGAYYADHESVGHDARMSLYSEMMGALSERFPEDVEARIFYALSLIAIAPADDMSYTWQKRAAAILEPLVSDRPDHPGITHYIIHAYDSPELAELGLGAAERYAAIAPASPHARHMPSHIFTRMGMWDESIASNLSVMELGRGAHAGEYLVYAYLQQGRDEEARKLVEEAEGWSDRYELALIPARYALERGDWEGATSLEIIRISYDRPAEGVIRFARALGAARSGDTETALSELDELARIRDAYADKGLAIANWAAAEVEILRLAAAAWTSLSAGDEEEALRLAAQASALEMATEDMSNTAGRILPAAELEGELLLETGRPQEALAAFEASLASMPNRARSLYGAARAAQLAGYSDSARRYFAALTDLMEKADTERPELLAARAYLTQGE
jgi:tetratricopeptide (TPR) repeat protein